MPNDTKPKSNLAAALASLKGRKAKLPNVKSALAALHSKSPLDAIQDTGDAEVDCAAEVSATLKAFKEQAQAEAKLFQDTTDSEYWCCICFQSRAQKEAFLRALAVPPDEDKYVDGVALAKAMQIELPPASVRFVEREVERSMVEIGLIEPPPEPKR